jgi:hypothetical protein
VKAGRARCITKPGQVFNRIHVNDIAQLIDKAVDMTLRRGAGGIFNAAVDEPPPPVAALVFAVSLIVMPTTRNLPSSKPKRR